MTLEHFAWKSTNGALEWSQGASKIIHDPHTQKSGGNGAIHGDGPSEGLKQYFCVGGGWGAPPVKAMCSGPLKRKKAVAVFHLI